VRECTEAESVIGPLRHASLNDVSQIENETIARRARHVISENQRVLDFTQALASGNYSGAGQLMRESHESLSHDFAVSIPQMDAVVRALCETSGVYGSRMTGGGFGGCVVTMCTPGTELDGWRVRPVGAAERIS
jgi:galactokinase